jgi:hypothetical protein
MSPLDLILMSRTSRYLRVRLCCAVALWFSLSALGCGSSQPSTEESPASEDRQSSPRVSEERSAREPNNEDAESGGTAAETGSEEEAADSGVQAVARESVEAAARSGATESEGAESQGSAVGTQETSEPPTTTTSSEPEGALRVVAWPKPEEASMFRALEEDDGVFRSAEGVPSPWVFIFALRDGNQEVAGIDIQLPEANGQGAPPELIYVGYTPTTVDVGRGSFRSVMRSAERLGKVDLTSSQPGPVHIEFETPVRAAILVLQVSNGRSGTPLLMDMVDVRLAGEPPEQDVPTVAVEAIPEDVGDSEILFVPSNQDELPDGGSPIDAMEDIGGSE